jgi:hypothetical protein
MMLTVEFVVPTPLMFAPHVTGAPAAVIAKRIFTGDGACAAAGAARANENSRASDERVMEPPGDYLMR